MLLYIGGQGTLCNFKILMVATMKSDSNFHFRRTVSMIQ